jgi:hypothetical protein
MLRRVVTTLTVIVSMLMAGHKKTEHAWREATLVAVENQFIQTGTSESGNVDNGQYSGRSHATGFNAIDFVLRTSESTIRLRLDTTPTAARIHPIAGTFAKPKVPNVAVNNTILYAIEGRTAWLRDSASKEYKLLVLSVNALPTDSTHPPTPSTPEVRNSTDPKPAPPIPDEMQKAIGVFLGKHLFVWIDEDARKYVGNPIVHRYAYDDAKNIIGDIFTYNDPTGEYERVELNFDSKTKRMVGVYLYPRKMTWEDCKRLWGDNVRIIKNQDGSEFRNYTDRHLNVYLDDRGNVISLGVY